MTVPQTADVVWAMLTDPALITQWSLASDDWHFPLAWVDLVVGGTQSAWTEAKACSFRCDFAGV